MFVDDDPSVLHGLRRTLSPQSLAWDLEFVNTAEKAEELIKIRPFDVLVVDVRMPGRTGLDLLRQTKSSDETRDTEVIMLTGLDGADLRKKALDLGAYDLLNKPVVREELIARLQGALRIKAYRAELEKKNAMLEKQLIQAQKMEVVGLLAAGVAHDLNNILAVIMGYAALAEQKFSSDAIDKGIVEMIKKIGNVSTRAGKITQQILKVSKETAISSETCSMNTILRECIETLKITSPPGIRIDLDDQSTDGDIQADASQMYQVFMNLFINGVQAMGNTGVLTVRLKEVGADSLPPGISGSDSLTPYLRVEVSDTGQGMDENTQKQIFDPLFTTKELKGTGLGLSVTQRIITNHKGHIAVESSPGKGSTFLVYLPVARYSKIDWSYGSLNGT
jgi:signal transduction histidine kinase